MKSFLPWWAKIIAKIILSRLPFSYAIWHKIGIFRHGYMDSIEYVLNVFDQHIDRAGLKGKIEGRTILELGPGDSIATAIVAYCYGAKSILIDAGKFALDDIGAYHKLVDDLRSKGFNPPDIKGAESLNEILEACNSAYLTKGLESFSTIEKETVDLIFSQAVLEHIRLSEFLDVMREMYRVQKSGGISSHRVDLKDHLGGSLHNLRFSRKTWESELFANSGFYTNRIRYSDMVSLFKQAGFNTEITAIRKWESLPLNKSHLDKEFTMLSDDDLLVSGFDVLLKK